MSDGFEHVLLVEDYYDGVRSGIAMYRGTAHTFRWLGWELDGWHPDEDRFRLRPVEDPSKASFLARGEFRNSATAPDPQCSPLVPQEVRWTPVE